MNLEHLEIPMPDGTTEAVLVRPDGNETVPGIIQLTDIFGLRSTYEESAKRIAERGYAVLTPNIFYRTSKPPVFDFEPDFGSERTQKRFGELTTPLTPDAIVRDGSAYIDFLSAQSSVSAGPMGVVGFCYSGQFALRMAAARPDRIAAAASFHGGRLATDAPDSPHLLLPRIKSRLYFGHAEGDRSMPAEVIAKLQAALRAWGGSYESETYVGAKHGWMTADGKAYNPQQADRGFAKLLSLFDAALKGRAAAS